MKAPRGWHLVRKGRYISRCCSVFRWFTLLFTALFASANAHGASFGLRTQIWPFMWAQGRSLEEVPGLNALQRRQWLVSEANLSVYKQLGANWNIVVIRQPENGEIDIRRIRRIINEHKSYGINVLFRLIEHPSVYTGLRTVAGQFGYNDDYYRWVYTLARQFGNDVRYFMIGNEIDHGLGHNLLKYKKINIDYSDYKKLLVTAHKAIKDADPDLSVVDHGVSSFTLGLVVTNEIMRRNGLFAASKFWRRFQYRRLSGAKSAARLAKMLGSESTKRRIRIAEHTYSDCKYYDAVQLHYYFAPEVLPDILAWMRNALSKSGCSPEIIATEIGYRTPIKKGRKWDGRPANVADWSKYSASEHAEVLVKDIVTLLASGVSKIQYWQLRFHHDRNPTATLYRSTTAPDEFSIWPAGKAYRFLVHLMQGSTPVKKLMLDVSGITEYRFSGIRDVSVVWADEQRKSTRVDFDSAGAISVVYDIYGNVVGPSSGGVLSLGREPLYVVWKKAVQ